MVARAQERCLRCRCGRGVQASQQAVDEQASPRRQGRIGREGGHAIAVGLAQAEQETLQVMALVLGQDWRRQRLQAEQPGQGGGGHGDGLQGKRQFEGFDALAGDPFQGHGTMLEGRLQRGWVHRVAGHRVDCQLLAVQIVPVKRSETVARQHSLAEPRRQYGLATARADRHLVLWRDAQAPGVVGMDLDEGAGLQLVQAGYLAGLGQRVPLVLDAAGVEHEGEGIVGQLRRRQPGAGEEPRLAGGRRKHRRLWGVWRDIAQRAASVLAPRRAWPLPRALVQVAIVDAAQVVTGVRIVEAADLIEHRFGVGVVEGVRITHGTGDARDQAPVLEAFAGRLDGAGHQGQVTLAVDHHPLALGPQCRRQQDVGVAVGLGVEEGVLADHQLCLAQAVDHLLAVGDAGHRVAADDPTGFYLPLLELLEQRHGAFAPFTAQGAGGQLPLRFDEGAVGRHLRRTLAR